MENKTIPCADCPYPQTCVEGGGCELQQELLEDARNPYRPEVAAAYVAIAAIVAVLVLMAVFTWRYFHGN